MRKIQFYEIKEEESEEVLEYLVSNCPDKLRIFAFDSCADMFGIGNGDFYLKGIEKVSARAALLLWDLIYNVFLKVLIKDNFK